MRLPAKLAFASLLSLALVQPAFAQKSEAPDAEKQHAAKAAEAVANGLSLIHI